MVSTEVQEIRYHATCKSATKQNILYFSDRASLYNSGKWPTWRTISSIICLFESSTCFKQLCAHLQEENSINTTSGTITLKTNAWSKITKIASNSSYFSNFWPLNCFQINYTKSCINTIILLMMSTGLLETCTGFKSTYYRRNCTSSWSLTRIGLLYQTNNDKCTHILLNHHPVNTVRISNIFNL